MVCVLLVGVLQWCMQGVDLALYSDGPVPLSNDRFTTGMIVGIAGVLVTVIAYVIGVRWPGQRRWLLSAITVGSVTAAILTAATLFDVNADQRSFGSAKE
ncbi:MAG: hypothetical protein NVSMB60_34890 [Mycobacterium sp.]